MSWKHWSLNGAKLKDIGVTDAPRLVQRANAAGTLTLSFKGRRCDAPFLWNFDELVVLRDGNNNVKWAGYVSTPATASASGNTESQTVVISCPWWRLERTIWQVQRPYAALGLDTKVLLGGVYQSFSEGDRNGIEFIPVDVAQTIASAVEFGGYDTGHRDIKLSGLMAPVEVDNVTLADAILSVLRWFPGAQAWFTYASQGSPTELFIKFNCSKPQSLPYFTASLTDLYALPEISPRTDLILPGVDLLLRKNVESNDGTRPHLYHSTAGLAEAGRPDVLTQPIELAPEVHSLEIATILVREIEINNLAFWKAITPGLEEFSTLVPDFSGPHNAIVVHKDDPTLDYVLEAGSIPKSFVEDGCQGPFGLRQTILDSSNSTEAKSGKVKISAMFQVLAASSESAAQYIRVTREFTGTNLSASGPHPVRYAHEIKDDFDPGESPLTFAGLAQQIYDSARTLGWQGSATFRATKPAPETVGRRLSITGGKAAWASMSVPITEVALDLSTMRRTVSYGPAEWLDANSLVQLLRALRHQRPGHRRKDEDGTARPPGNNGSPPEAASNSESTYTPRPGKLMINITPEGAVNNGATWYADSGTGVLGPFKSGKFVALPPATYTITFGAVSGFKPPEPVEGIVITQGSVDTLPVSPTSTLFEYTELAGLVPFCPEVRKKSGEEGVYEVRIRDGILFAADLETEIEITDLNEWITIEGDSFKIFLEGTVSSLEASEVSVKSTSSDWPARATFDSTPEQEKFNRKLTEIKMVDGKPKIHALTVTHLALQPICSDPAAIIYPFPY